MTGNKPDPRLRTPMQWRRGKGGGFTAGTAWEPLQRDSMTANVEVEDADGASLLNHYRRLIHLRSENAALGYGDFVPLSTGLSAVVAYLRRKDNRTVLVVANLGGKAISGLSLSSTGNVLQPGEYSAKSLLGKSVETRLRVSGSGAIDKWIPVGTIEPHEAHIIDVSRRD